MHARERAIRERFAGQDCSRCRRPYVHPNVLVLVRRGNTWLVLVTCPRCDHRGIFVISFPRAARHDEFGRQAINPVDMDVRALSPTSLAEAMPDRTVAGAVTQDDVQQMHAFLQTFDGDFRRAFAES